MKGFALLLVLLPLAASAATITGNRTADQRGLPRLSGAHVDIGAYELQ